MAVQLKVANRLSSTSQIQPVVEGKKKRRLDCHRCMKKSIRFLLLAFAIFNLVWGFTEVVLAMILNFLALHPEGPEGFTSSTLQLTDITYFEHREWEMELLPTNREDIQTRLDDEEKLEPVHQITKEEKEMLRVRDYLIKNCSKFKRGKKSKVTVDIDEINDKDCLKGTPENQQKNYFCAIIEKPERQHKAFRPLIVYWLIISLIYFFSIPLLLFSFFWKSQQIRLLFTYCFIQIIPVCLTIFVIYRMWISYGFELCSLDIMFNFFPTRAAFTVLFTIRMFMKLFETTGGVYHCHLIHVAKEHKNYGLAVKRNRPGQNAASLLPIIRHNEVLQHGHRPAHLNSDSDDDDDDDDVEKGARKNRKNLNDTPDHITRASIIKVDDGHLHHLRTLPPEH